MRGAGFSSHRKMQVHWEVQAVFFSLCVFPWRALAIFSRLAQVIRRQLLTIISKGKRNYPILQSMQKTNLRMTRGVQPVFRSYRPLDAAYPSFCCS